MSTDKPNIGLVTTPLSSGHSIRGIGNYTRFLLSTLEKESEISLQPVLDLKQIKDLDLIHYPFFDLFFSTLQIPSKPIVVTIHDVIPLQYAQAYPVGFRGKFALWQQSRKLKKVKKIITDSYYSKKMIEEFLKQPEAKIQVIPLAPRSDLNIISNNKAFKNRQKLKLPSKYLLYVGDINYNKNLISLIKSFRYLPDDLHLVLLGSQFFPHDIPEWQSLERTLAATNITHKTHFLTSIKVDEVELLASVYAGAQCYVQPSLSEGFGLPVLEAQKCGVPVVSSNTGALMEIGGEGTIFVDPTAEGLAKGIGSVLQLSTDERNNIISAGLKNQAKYTWEKTAKLTLAVYLEVLAHEKNN